VAAASRLRTFSSPKLRANFAIDRPPGLVPGGFFVGSSPLPLCVTGKKSRSIYSDRLKPGHGGGPGWGGHWHGGWGGPGYWGAGLIGLGVGAAIGTALAAMGYVGPPPPPGAYVPVAGAYGPPAWTPELHLLRPALLQLQFAHRLFHRI
jgi:hypothetical protein